MANRLCTNTPEFEIRIKVETLLLTIIVFSIENVRTCMCLDVSVSELETTVIFQPISAFGWAKSNLVGQIYCTYICRCILTSSDCICTHI